jgi:hypothetical protein
MAEEVIGSSMKITNNFKNKLELAKKQGYHTVREHDYKGYLIIEKKSGFVVEGKYFPTLDTVKEWVDDNKKKHIKKLLSILQELL